MYIDMCLCNFLAERIRPTNRCKSDFLVVLFLIFGFCNPSLRCMKHCILRAYDDISEGRNIFCNFLSHFELSATSEGNFNTRTRVQFCHLLDIRYMCATCVIVYGPDTNRRKCTSSHFLCLNISWQIDKLIFMLLCLRCCCGERILKGTFRFSLDIADCLVWHITCKLIRFKSVRENCIILLFCRVKVTQ